MANTSVKSSTKSKKTQPAASRPRSAQAAAQALIPSVKPSFKNDSEALKCSLILLQQFCQSMIPRYQLKSIVMQAQLKAQEHGIENVEENFEQLVNIIVQERYKNPINAALDQSGFW